MTGIADNRILQGTRLLIYLIMGLLVFVGTVIVAGSALLPIFWSEAGAAVKEAHPAINTGMLFTQMLVIFAVLLIVIGLIGLIMRNLLTIITSVKQGDPFARVNAARLRAIGWVMIALQVIGYPLAVMAGRVADMFGPSDVGPDLDLNGILAILLVFILAGIFEYGAEMREDLEGTV